MTLRVDLVEFGLFETEISQIRQAVFQLEQQVDEKLDFDGLDSQALQLLAYLNDLTVGTARIRLLNFRTAKLERVAVLAQYRGRGVGRLMVQRAIQLLAKQKVLEIQLHAQAPTIAFYRQLGFESQGEPFYEANILHIAMVCKLSST